MVNGNNRADVAVFIDFENVYVSVRDKLDANPNFESIMDRCADLGRVVIAKAYADWYRYPRVTSALYANGIEPMYVPTYYYDREMGRTGRAIKNSVDIHICIDAMKTLFTTTNIAKFVLVTGDRDFIPLVNSIRQQGKEVVVIGIGGAASAHLAQSADEFIFYEQLVGMPTVHSTPASELLDDRPKAKMPEKERERSPEPAPAPVLAPEPDVFDTLVEAIKLARKRNYVSTLGSLKLLMKELMGGDFKENKYRDTNGRPFAKFKDFVLEAERRGKVQVFTSGTVNEVFLPNEDPQTLSQFSNVLGEEQPAAEAVAEEVEVEEALPAAPVAGAVPAGRSRRRRRRSRPDRRDGTDGLPQGEGEEIEELTGADEVLSDEALSDEEFVAIDEPGVDELLVADELLVVDSPVEAEASIDIEAPEPAEVVEGELAQVVEGEPAEGELAAAAEEEPVVEPVLRLVVPLIPEPLAVVEEEQNAPPLTIDELVERAPELAEESIEVIAAAAEVGVAAEEAAAETSFNDEEWQLFRHMASGFEKAVSFRQIFNALRDLRNEKQINRTNIELELLVKQAINSDMFERSGRGARITYRLRPEFRDESVSADAQG